MITDCKYCHGAHQTLADCPTVNAAFGEQSRRKMSNPRQAEKLCCQCNSPRLPHNSYCAYHRLAMQRQQRRARRVEVRVNRRAGGER